jgi:hypothetical protein
MFLVDGVNYALTFAAGSIISCRAQLLAHAEIGV